MSVDDALRALVRPVVVLSAAGTISMRGERATPALDAGAPIDSVPALAAVARLSAENVRQRPGAHLSLDDALAVGRRAAALASEGRGRRDHHRHGHTRGDCRPVRAPARRRGAGRADGSEPSGVGAGGRRSGRPRADDEPSGARSMLFETYGFEGSEADVRQTDAVCVPFLSASAARIALLCCLGAGLDRRAIAAALGAYDAT